VRRLGLLALCGCLSGAAGAAEILVLPGQSLAAALKTAGDGDEIHLVAGLHRGQVGVIRQRRLTIKGVGGRAVLDADGQHAQGKGTLVVVNGEVRIENLEFRGARVPDRNGAGIRFERGRLEVVDCVFVDNQTGILTGNVADAELRVLNSEFRQAPPTEKSLPHLLYVGRIASLMLADSRFEGGRRGHLVKSRARQNHVFDNHIVDGPGGTASYELEFPEGGVAVVVGNTIGQSASTENPSIVSYGAEARPDRDDGSEHMLIMVRNTLLNQRRGDSVFVRTYPDRLPRPLLQRFVANTYRGSGTGPPGWDDVELGNLHAPAAR
jgi:hypothetical protein